MIKQGHTVTDLYKYGKRILAIYRDGQFIYKYMRVPAEYKEVKSLTLDGASYINTGLSFPNGFKMIAKAKYTKTSGEGTLAGVQGKSGSTYLRSFAPWCFSTGSTTFSVGVGAGGAVRSTTNYSTSQFYNYEVSTIIGKVYVSVNKDNANMNTVAEALNDLRASSNIYIFAINNIASNNVAAYFQGVVEGDILLYNDKEKLVRHYIPCVRKADDEPGLYDTLTDTFYVNAGSGTITPGQEVTTIGGE